MARAWHLKSRPSGMPTADNFELKEIDLPALGDGQVRVRNLWLSVDPYMRGRMNDVKSYVPPFQVGEPLEGGAVGEVVESKADGFAAGRPRAAHGRLARRGGGPGARGSTSCPTSAPSRRIPRRPRRDRRHGLFRPARRRERKGRRHRVRLGRRGRRRLGRSSRSPKPRA